MDDSIEINARIQTLEAQRNVALTKEVMLSGVLAAKNARIAELEKRVAELEPKTKRKRK